MKCMLAGAVALAVLSAPAYAQETKAPDSGAKIAEAGKMISQLKQDKEKLKIYCEVQSLREKSDQAAEKDQKQAEALSSQADEKSKQLGSDFDKLMELVSEVDPESEGGKKIYAQLDELDKGCGS